MSNHSSDMKMPASKNLGIFMDHSSANLIEFDEGAIKSRVIGSPLTIEVKQATLATKGEHTLHRKEKNLDSKYYQSIGEQILKFDDVLLFGPTEAKRELVNLIRSDHRFSKIHIGVQTTDKMTQAQQEAFVRDYFLNEERA